ncbi:hypothetical protein SAMN05660297_02159 [Natronincola peptidivorans]|uniref:Uncharacterized protein n=1 Tax=Natronincola peptidivorans TaxID=426128 RepID=A0A1I0DWS0_9FIRM|nr:hypothetical protein [Natronincola peptidivorans]SET36472.1 hypothetical protein SAMN05660297_02159 [Natronincola peptidivorans]
MKKIISLIILVLLALTIFTGCSYETEKSEEALQEGITEEIEEEIPQEQEVDIADENQESTSDFATDEERTFYLSNLRNGDEVGEGLIIRDIYIEDEYTSFILAGDIALTGELSYDHQYYEAMMFTFPDDIFPTIVIEGEGYNQEHIEFTYKPSHFVFRNEDALFEALPHSDLIEVIEEGKTMNVGIGVKDLNFIGYWQSEYGASVEFVEIIDIM